MKVGILTFHFAPNYGAVLQTVGTARVLKELSCEPVVIDYQGFGQVPFWYGFGPNSLKEHGLTNCIRNKITFSKFKLQLISYIKENALFSKRVTNIKELAKLSENFQAILVGSDQIWNPEITNDNRNYYLGFSKCRRIAWSASVGDRKSSLSSEILEDLKKFHSISVRDEETQNQLRIGFTTTLTADPTLLADFSQDTEIENSLIKRIPKRFILVYAFKHVDYLASAITIAKKTFGIPVISIGSYKPEDTDVHLGNEAPSTWLWLFKQASFVVTHSFHGTIFSLKNSKDFICVSSQNAPNLRVHDLLKRYGCEDRIVYPCEESVMSELLRKSIDYDSVNRNINNHVSLSKTYLRNALNAR